ncbi:MAG: monooxygenase, partial [Desulfuromonadales bacterium]|nr:monooxygenase [Desulfuromonadales bacterium]
AEKLGGVWADGYVNFGVQVQKELYEFPDWPLPAAAPTFTPGPVMQQYLEDYCDHFDVRPALRLKSSVRSIEPANGGKRGWRILYDQDGETKSETFDFVVIATGLYSEMP